MPKRMPGRQTLSPPLETIRRTALTAPGGLAPAAAPRPQSGREAFLRIAPVAVLAIGVMLPVEVRLNLAGQTMYAYRIAWLAFAPWIIFKMLSGKFAYRFIDALVALSAAWMALAFTVVEGVGKGLPSGTAIALDVLMPYLITRHCIASTNDLRRLLVLMAPIALAIGGMMILESVLHTRFIRDGAQAIFGALSTRELGDVDFRGGQIDTRFGLMRAMGPFSHPILAGLFFAGLMPLYWFSKLRGWPYLVGLASGIGAVFSLSSAAFAGLGMFVILAFVDRLRKLFTFFSWPTFLILMAGLGVLLQVASQNGLISVLIRFTMNPATGYYRLLIWEYGSKMVERRPLFGSGYAPFQGLFWMGDSVDTIWLQIAIRSGLPAAVALGLAVLVAIVGLGIAASRSQENDQSTRIGLAITLAMFFALGFTVSFFGGMLIWFVMMLGAGVSLGQFLPPARRMAPRRPVARLAPMGRQ